MVKGSTNNLQGDEEEAPSSKVNDAPSSKVNDVQGKFNSFYLTSLVLALTNT